MLPPPRHRSPLRLRTDFISDPRGEVLVFEANATMAFWAPDPDPRWDYRRPAVENICRAIRKMLLQRAGVAAVAKV